MSIFPACKVQNYAVKIKCQKCLLLSIAIYKPNVVVFSGILVRWAGNIHLSIESLAACHDLARLFVVGGLQSSALHLCEAKQWQAQTQPEDLCSQVMRKEHN